MKNLGGVTWLVAEGDPLPAFDFQCPLLGLPLAFGTRLDTIPAPDGYIDSDPARTEAWSASLGARTRPRVGLVWSGSTGHKNDRNRSISLAELVKFLPEGFQYVCLQKEVRAADKLILEGRADILQFSDAINDFTDTASLCSLVDVVLTVDTSVAHLAGALGKQVWVLLPFTPDWRWLLDRDDSPWYPKARLYRQAKADDWVEILARVGADLNEHLS